MGRVNHNGYSREQAVESVGPGWTPLVNRVFDAIDEQKLDVVVVQVKEKFAGLRIYVEGADYQRVRPVISAVEGESFGLCERCGAPGNLYDDDGWLRTCCTDHAGDATPKGKPSWTSLP